MDKSSFFSNTLQCWLPIILIKFSSCCFHKNFTYFSKTFLAPSTRHFFSHLYINISFPFSFFPPGLQSLSGQSHVLLHEILRLVNSNGITIHTVTQNTKIIKQNYFIFLILSPNSSHQILGILTKIFLNSRFPHSDLVQTHFSPHLSYQNHLFLVHKNPFMQYIWSRHMQKTQEWPKYHLSMYSDMSSSNSGTDIGRKPSSGSSLGFYLLAKAIRKDTLFFWDYK